jgi:hypothetical protein
MSRKEWAYARMGDRFISRVPAAVQQDISRTITEADAYISDYNIYMGNLRNEMENNCFHQYETDLSLGIARRTEIKLC